MTSRIRTVFTILLPFLVTSCAATRYESIADQAADKKATGIRYYDSSPYLLVMTTPDGNANAQLYYLPDRTKEFQARPVCFLSANTTTCTYANGTSTGVLTSTANDVDSTAVPVAIVQALSTFAESYFKPAGAGIGPKPAAAPPSTPKIYLCKIVKENHEWGLLVAEEDIRP